MKDEADVEIQQTLGIAGGKRKRLLTNPIVVLVAAGLAVAAFLYFYTQSNAPDGPRYATAEIARGDLTVTVAATGELAPLNEVEISTEVSGRIDAVFVDNNDPVELGQLLAQIDTSELEAQVSRARASTISAEARIEEAEATFADAQRNVNRIEPLANRGVVTQEDLDNARSQLDRARAGLASSRAQLEVATAELEQAEARLLKADVISPVNGIVLDRAIDPGQTVAASMQAPVLFKLAEGLEQMELNVAVDEADIGMVREGQSATFTVDAYPQRTFEAETGLVRFAPSLVEGVVTYETTLLVDNSDLLLRPGMTASAIITVDQVSGALLVPNEAFRYDPNAGASFVASGPGGLTLQGARSREADEEGRREIFVMRDGERTSLYVSVGATDGRMTAVESDELEEGDEVILYEERGA